MVIDNEALSLKSVAMVNESSSTLPMSALNHPEMHASSHDENTKQTIPHEMIILPHSNENKTSSPVMTAVESDLEAGQSPIPDMKESNIRDEIDPQSGRHISISIENDKGEKSPPRDEKIETPKYEKEATNECPDTSERRELMSETNENKHIKKVNALRRNKKEVSKPKQSNKSTKITGGKANSGRAEKKKQEVIPSTKSTRKGKRGPKKQKELSHAPPPHKLILNKVRAQVRQLTYHQHFVQAYESEGWNRKNGERLKPYESLLEAKQKVVAGKRSIIHLLGALRDLHKHDRQFDYLAPEYSHLLRSSSTDGQTPIHEENRHQYVIYCSRCNSTNTIPENDIIICDSEGCNRAYHQKCQNPPVATSDIPLGDALWYCEICEALFKSLKCINTAFGTAYETIDEVFPELKGGEVEALQKQSTNPQKSQTACSWLDVLRGTNDSRDDESADEDFTPKIDKGDNSGDSPTNSESDHTYSHKTIKHSEISDDEIAFLSRENVINTNRRSLRSSVAEDQNHHEIPKITSDHNSIAHLEPARYLGQVASSNYVPRVSAHLMKSEAPSFYYKDGIPMKETNRTPRYPSVYENSGPSHASTAFHPQIVLKSAVAANPTNQEYRPNNHAPSPYSIGDVVTRAASHVPVATSPTDLVGTEIIKVTTLHKAKVFGLVVDCMWKVKYDDATEEFLTWNELQCAITKAREQTTNNIQGVRVPQTQDFQLSNSVAVKGKRKRSAVNYRQLNSLLFADKADSDDEPRESIPKSSSSPNRPYNETLNSQPSASAREPKQVQRRRGRRAVNYRVMHEGTTPAED